MLCQIVGDSVRQYLGATRLNGAALQFATWMPFPTSYYDAGMRSRAPATMGRKQKEGEENDKQSLSQECVVPVFVSATAADGKDIVMLLPLELVLDFGGYGHGLREVKIWDRSTIDVETIRAWLSDCHENHGESCNSMLAGIPLPQSLRLIDTTDWCVVTAPTSAGYLALSYVWTLSGSLPATHKPFQLELGNMAELEKNNGFKTAGDKLPELLADAIQLSADLGYRYLWVDRLCIAQDDDADKRHQLQAMDAIYHAADLTIVALGDGSAPGLQGTSSRPRKLSLGDSNWNFVVRDRGNIGVQTQDIHMSVLRSRWNDRGWTYQERLLSRRHLFLTDVNFYLNCYKSRCVSEGRLRSSDGYEKGIKALFTPAASHNSADGVALYATAVRDYTARDLTYNSDILNAFAGVSNVFSVKHETAMLSGLPEKHFIQALLWRHMEGDTYRPRSLPDGPHVPSWGWAAWEGCVVYNFVCWSFDNQQYSMDATSGAHIGCLVHFNYSDPSSGAVRPLKEYQNWFRDNIKGEADLLLACVHSPSEADRNATITNEGRLLAQTMPGSLVFNTTVVLATLRNSKARSGHGQQSSRSVVAKSGCKVGKYLGRDRHNYNANTESWARIVFDIIDGKGNQVGQTFPFWNSSDNGDDYYSKKRAGGLRERLKSGKKYLVAVVAACRSNDLLSSGDKLGLVVMVMDHDGDTGISRRLTIGAVDPGAWTRAEPTWETVVLA